MTSRRVPQRYGIHRGPDRRGRVRRHVDLAEVVIDIVGPSFERTVLLKRLAHARATVEHLRHPCQPLIAPGSRDEASPRSFDSARNNDLAFIRCNTLPVRISPSAPREASGRPTGSASSVPVTAQKTSGGVRSLGSGVQQSGALIREITQPSARSARIAMIARSARIAMIARSARIANKAAQDARQIVGIIATAGSVGASDDEALCLHH